MLLPPRTKRSFCLALVLSLGLLASSCATVDAEYQRAEQRDTIAAYKDYLAANPRTPYKKIVTQRLLELSYREAQKFNDITTWVAFMTSYPEAATLTTKAAAYLEILLCKQAERQNSLQSYEAYLERYPDDNCSESFRGKRDLLFFAAAQTENTTTAYRKYLAKFPTGNYTGKAQRLLVAAAFQASRKQNTARAYKQFRSNFPGSTWNNQALESEAALAFATATAQNTPTAWSNYLTNYPQLFTTKAKMAWARSIYQQNIRAKSPAAWEKFIADFADYQELVASAQARLAALHFAAAQSQNQVAGWEAFLQRFADSIHLLPAQNALANLLLAENTQGVAGLTSLIARFPNTAAAAKAGQRLNRGSLGSYNNLSTALAKSDLPTKISLYRSFLATYPAASNVAQEYCNLLTEKGAINILNPYQDLPPIAAMAALLQDCPQSPAARDLGFFLPRLQLVSWEVSPALGVPTADTVAAALINDLRKRHLHPQLYLLPEPSSQPELEFLRRYGQPKAHLRLEVFAKELTLQVVAKSHPDNVTSYDKMQRLTLAGQYPDNAFDYQLPDLYFKRLVVELRQDSQTAARTQIYHQGATDYALSAGDYKALLAVQACFTASNELGGKISQQITKLQSERRAQLDQLAAKLSGNWILYTNWPQADGSFEHQVTMLTISPQAEYWSLELFTFSESDQDISALRNRQDRLRPADAERLSPMSSYYGLEHVEIPLQWNSTMRRYDYPYQPITPQDPSGGVAAELAYFNKIATLKIARPRGKQPAIEQSYQLEAIAAKQVSGQVTSAGETGEFFMIRTSYQPQLYQGQPDNN